MDCSPPGSSVHGIFQARILEWVAISSSRGTSQSGNQTRISCMAGGFFTTDPPGNPCITCSSVQFSHSVMSNSLWPMDCSTPGLPVYHQFPEPAQTHVHWVSDAIQPSQPLSSPSPSAFNLSQHQGLFKWVSSSHQEAKVLDFQLQPQSSPWIFRTDFL